MTLLLQIVSRNSEIALQWTFNGETQHRNQRQLVFNEYWWNNGVPIDTQSLLTKKGSSVILPLLKF